MNGQGKPLNNQKNDAGKSIAIMDGLFSQLQCVAYKTKPKYFR